MSARKINVLVYSGPEIPSNSLSSIITTLRTLLVPNYAVQIVPLKALSQHPWADACALLVLPAVSRTPILLPGFSDAIRAYVEGGGSLLAFGVGVRVQEKATTGLDGRLAAMNPGESSSTVDFTDKTTAVKLAITLQARSDEEVGVSTLQLPDGSSISDVARSGETGIPQIPPVDNITILAHYLDGNDRTGVAGLLCHINSGKVIIWDPLIEIALVGESASATIASELTDDQATSAEEARLVILGNTLRTLDLELPARKSKSILRPLPQLLTSIPSRIDIVPSIMKALSIDLRGSAPQPIVDETDMIQFQPFSVSETVLKDARALATVESDPSFWQPKDIIVYADGHLPSFADTPLFDLKRYFHDLAAARSAVHTPLDTNGWRMGDALLYGEVVTSTQTMLDKNRRLLSSLPTPLLSLASHQLAGRGRGANVWLSPAGCLQFSLLLRASLTTLPAQRLVFVQYLVALAVVAACRDEAVLGTQGASVRLKWPNDVYAIDRRGERRKIGGILVNTSISDGRTEIIIGCGVNVLNPPPIMSLLQLLSDQSDARLSMERTMATIMAKFEPMWETFLVAKGSFDPFMDDYLETWLHSDELVTLTTTTPPQKVRIAGITQYGLLRTVPERDGWSGVTRPEFVDLQPDGNSFDMLSGLIKTKT